MLWYSTNVRAYYWRSRQVGAAGDVNKRVLNEQTVIRGAPTDLRRDNRPESVSVAARE